MSLPIRDYQPSDLLACLEVFDSNVPKYFSLEEREEFIEFLSDPAKQVYLVLELEGHIVGCGGYYTQEDQGGFSWGMVNQSRHGSGLGKRLALERLFQLSKIENLSLVKLDTSQHTFGFFEKLGFVTQEITPNGYWEGLDRYDMKLTLTPQHHQNIQTMYQEQA